MKEFWDNLYMFSMARSSVGRILLARGKNAEGAMENRNLFALLGISRQECAFFYDCIRFGNIKCVAVKGKRRGRDRVVLIFGGFSFSTAFFIASDLGFPAWEVARILIGDTFQNVAISDGVRQLAESEVGVDLKKTSQADTEEYVRWLFDCLTAKESEHFHYIHGESEVILDTAKRFASVTGANLSFDLRNVENTDGTDRELAEIFDGAVCSMVMLAVMMFAQLHGKEKKVALDLISYGSKPVLHFRFLGARTKVWPSLYENIYSAVQSCHEFEIDCQLKGNSVELWFCPVYADVGLTGVKRRPVSFYYEEEFLEKASDLTE